MQAVIYEPLEEYEQKLKTLHEEKTAAFFEKLVRQSGVDVEKNRETVRQARPASCPEKPRIPTEPDASC